MATVRLSFSPEPAHVRTARLVGVAVARRAGIDGDLLDEVRLAIGEACSRAVALHRRHGLRTPISIEMTDGPVYEVRVVDQAPADATAAGAVPDLAVSPAVDALDAPPDGLSEEAVAAGMGLTLLASLVDSLEVRRADGGTGTSVRMVWSPRPTR
ncbi:MAG TPA: ATP-binding protein [Micromonosporaceae bacterium]|nr:ATP-binding protein [Micromonosporaceae bacterium]